MPNSYNTTHQELANISGVNMSPSSASIEEINRIMSYGANATDAPVLCATNEEYPAFGTHIREAVDIVKDWVRK